MTGNGLIEGLADREAAEVEGLAPSELVNVGREVVVAVQRKNNVNGRSQVQSVG